MIRVHFREVDETLLGTVEIPFIPRIGESVSVSGQRHRVKDVDYGVHEDAYVVTVYLTPR